MDSIHSFLTPICFATYFHHAITFTVTLAIRRFLRDENFGSGLHSDILDGLTLFADDKTYISVSHFDLLSRFTKRTCFSNIDAHLRLTRVFVDDSFNCFFGNYILFVVCFYEHIPYISVLDFAFCNLNFSSTFILKSSDCFSFLAND